MPSARTRVAALFAAALVLIAAAGGGASSPDAAIGTSVNARAVDGQAGSGTLRADRLARLAAWRGGPIRTSTGETVTVLVSDSLPLETPEKWAEFLVHLAHGPEITTLEATIASLAEVEGICGGSALGCYAPDRMVAVGEITVDGTTPEEVVRHEYGHHVGYHRLNAPWDAIDWGPKHWATAASVCPKVKRREAFPGDGGRNYAQNPGEAWAEVYRLMDERRAGITTGRWEIIAQSFFPNAAAIAAAERDVLQPWTKSRTASYRRTFGTRTKVSWVPLKTPLDGDLKVTARVSKGGLFSIALVGANRTSVVARAQWVGQRTKRLSASVCGQRSLFLRLTRNGPPGTVNVTVSSP